VPKKPQKRDLKHAATPESVRKVLLDIGLSEAAVNRLPSPGQEQLAHSLATVLRGAGLSEQEQNQVVDAVGRALERCAAQTEGLFELHAVCLELINATGLTPRAQETLSALATLLNRTYLTRR